VPAVARVLIVGGGCRGIGLARALVAEEQAVRVTTRSEAGRAAIEQAGAECWIGDPDRLATMRGALDRVTVLCWMLAGAAGSDEQLSALFGERLEFFMTQAIDTTVRGVVYERGEDEEGRMGELLGGGEAIVRRLAELNRIPLQILAVGPGDAGWREQALGAIGRLLGQPS
jgi:hypothetical protein